MGMASPSRIIKVWSPRPVTRRSFENRPSVRVDPDWNAGVGEEAEKGERVRPPVGKDTAARKHPSFGPPEPSTPWTQLRDIHARLVTSGGTKKSRTTGAQAFLRLRLALNLDSFCILLLFLLLSTTPLKVQSLGIKWERQQKLLHRQDGRPSSGLELKV